MSSHNYKWCVVPYCDSTTKKTPQKLFIQMLSDKKQRNAWLKLARRKPNLSNKSILYFCEDHFNLEHDMENFMQYKIMGSVKRIKMRPNCKPTRYECQPDRKCTLEKESSRTVVTKRQRISLIQDTLKETLSTDKLVVTPSSSCDPDCEIMDNIVLGDSKVDQATQIEVKNQEHKAVQASVSSKYRSKSTQSTKLNIRDFGSSPIKSFISVATSPLKNKLQRVMANSISSKRKLFFTTEETFERELSYTPSLFESTSEDSIPSKILSKTTSTSDSSLNEIIKNQDKKENLQNTLKKIKNKPRLYLGVPKELYFLLDIIQKRTKIPEEHILLCLTKIRLNSTLSQLADDFGVSLAQACKIFQNKLPLIVNTLAPFIKSFTNRTIKINLPIAFRHKYYKVTSIIDCLEVEIQKPTKAIHQALTWSEYKKANTIKYLISCTPDGLVNFVSAGYGGRITDVQLVEESKFLESLKPGACILADRGFKHIEIFLSQRGFTLLRPPSVTTGSKLTKDEVRLTKRIASLRIHVERLIRRIREFSILKLHSVVNINTIPVLDLCIITACAIINLQDSLIK